MLIILHHAGGTAGCIVASRLASADPDLTVLVIEGGMNNYKDPSIVNIGFFFAHILPDSKRTLFYPSKESECLAGRSLTIPCGGVLGGGSSINMAMYSRAQRSDFDAWDMPGWSTEEMMPFIKKVSLSFIDKAPSTKILALRRSLRLTTERAPEIFMATTGPSIYPKGLGTAEE